MGQQDRPLPGVGFGVPRFQRAALSGADGAADFQRPSFAVEVLPFETAQLTPAQTYSQFRVEEVVPEGILANRCHEGVQLFIVENTLRLV